MTLYVVLVHHTIIFNVSVCSGAGKCLQRPTKMLNGITFLGIRQLQKYLY